MGKKNLLDVAAAGTSVFNQLAAGNNSDIKYVQDTKNAKGTKNAKDTKSTGAKRGRPPKANPEPQERFNIRIPTELKEYLTIAAARESIATRKTVSPTKYLCGLIRQDMEAHKDD